jgi:hypothetical protein
MSDAIYSAFPYWEMQETGRVGTLVVLSEVNWLSAKSSLSCTKIQRRRKCTGNVHNLLIYDILSATNLI